MFIAASSILRISPTLPRLLSTRIKQSSATQLCTNTRALSIFSSMTPIFQPTLIEPHKRSFWSRKTWEDEYKTRYWNNLNEVLSERFKIEQAKITKIKNEGKYLRMPKELQTYDVWLKEIEFNWQSLEYIPDNLLSSKICLKALNQSWRALRFVPKELQTYDMCIKAVNQDWEAIMDVRADLQTYHMAMLCLGQYGFCSSTISPHPLGYIREELQTEEMVTFVVKLQRYSLAYVRQDLQTVHLIKLALAAEEKFKQSIISDIKNPFLRRLFSIRYPKDPEDEWTCGPLGL